MSVNTVRGNIFSYFVDLRAFKELGPAGERVNLGKQRPKSCRQRGSCGRQQGVELQLVQQFPLLLAAELLERDFLLCAVNMCLKEHSSRRTFVFEDSSFLSKMRKMTPASRYAATMAL